MWRRWYDGTVMFTYNHQKLGYLQWRESTTAKKKAELRVFKASFDNESICTYTHTYQKMYKKIRMNTRKSNDRYSKDHKREVLHELVFRRKIGMAISEMNGSN